MLPDQSPAQGNLTVKIDKGDATELLLKNTVATSSEILCVLCKTYSVIA